MTELAATIASIAVVGVVIFALMLWDERRWSRDRTKSRAWMRKHRASAIRFNDQEIGP